MGWKKGDVLVAIKSTFDMGNERVCLALACGHGVERVPSFLKTEPDRVVCLICTAAKREAEKVERKAKRATQAEMPLAVKEVLLVDPIHVKLFKADIKQLTAAVIRLESEVSALKGKVDSEEAAWSISAMKDIERLYGRVMALESGLGVTPPFAPTTVVNNSNGGGN